MKRFQLELLLNFVKVLHDATDEIERQYAQGRYATAVNLLGDCQEAVGHMVNFIEETEGENTRSVELLADYYRRLFEIAGNIETIGSAFIGELRETVRNIQAFIVDELKPRKMEIAFLPYKASMWDSMESVWMAAKEDPDCEVYVVPIPYYDRKPDGALGEFRYEGNQFPDYVPITHYEFYDIAKRRPDVIYIHNPYDGFNRVTSVDPRFYSHELKKHTDTLVYIPYYSSSGSLGEGQRNLPAYHQADFIVIQSEKFRQYFDAGLQDKLLPLGSPKFDRLIRICGQPPEPPADWKEKMAGKKAYFFNTSIAGLLKDTENYLKKMEYVFSVFASRDDACLVWRPHPLLESTLDSMRPQYKAQYAALKARFIESELGIYDDTPDVTNTIALCDAYVGDAGSSLVSLFGIAGKPVFILNHDIHAEPGEDGWKNEINPVKLHSDRRYYITRYDQLYYSPENNFKYRYLCDLTEYGHAHLYSNVITIDDQAYICPVNAQDILVLRDGQIAGRIELEKRVDRPGAFARSLRCGKYIFLIPNLYPDVVRYDTASGEVRYFPVQPDIVAGVRNGERVTGSVCVYKGYLFFASPVNHLIWAIEAESGKEQMLATGGKYRGGYMNIVSDGESLWLMPYEGTTVTCWNPETGEVREYLVSPEGFSCRRGGDGSECMEQPFSRPAFYGDDVYLAPHWGNMFVKLNRVTGEAVPWQPPFAKTQQSAGGSSRARIMGNFAGRVGPEGHIWQFVSLHDKKIYQVDLKNHRYEEIRVEFNVEELKAHAPGFKKYSPWLPYCCVEDAFNPLSAFLSGKLCGNPYSREEQLASWSESAASLDGTCGEKVHRFMKRRFDDLLGRLSG